MLVTVNGVPDQMAEGTSVDDVVERLGRGRAGIAVAVNEEVVPRSQWRGAHLRDGDRVEVLTAAQGG
jgi:sulfur carrier protein